MDHPLLARITRLPVVGILRGFQVDRAVEAARSAVEAGIGLLEVTMDSPRPLDQISRILSAVPDVTIGVGSVLTRGQVQQAVQVGASFIVSPVVDRGVIETSTELGLAVFPGASTPTEIEKAVRLGVTAVKVFPARELGGPRYIAAISAPLGHPRLIPTGGVTLESAAKYLAAGAVALGVGSDLFDPDDDPATTGDRALAWVAALS
jgi:2-dehydro-3-deoxyphosphogluconate aldolase/(4S)-4-hydroxy-2-oxoglutarate aldolase